MRQSLHHLPVTTEGQDLVDITSPIRHWVTAQRAGTGLLTVWCRHTSASLLVQENADPDVRADLLAFFRRLVPEGAQYRHRTKAPTTCPRTSNPH
jgi:secondary thiamine-phosphate synthase enzyme